MQSSLPPGPRRTHRNAARTAGFTLAVVACLLSSTALAKKKPMPLNWVPALTSLKKPDPRLKKYKDRVIFRQNGIVVQLELLDDRRRSLFLESAGIQADPFATSTLGERAWTFLVRVENTAEVPLTFRPPAVSLFTKKPLSVNSSCDFLCLQDAAAKAGLGDDGFKKLMAVALDTAETLRPGDRLSKIMAFVRVPERFKLFVLEMDGFVIGDDNLRYAVPYRPDEENDNERTAAGEADGSSEDSR